MKALIPYLNAAMVVYALAVGCTTSRPPSVTVCLGDGLGGCDGNDRTGQRISKSPSELGPASPTGSWLMMPQPEFAEFAAWCYDVDVKTALVILERATKNGDSLREAQKRYFAEPSRVLPLSQNPKETPRAD